MSFRAFRSGLRRLLRSNAVEREWDDEVADYLENATARHVQAGMSRLEAERAARLELGGADQVKEQLRSAGWESLIETLGQDVRYGWRGMRRAPMFTLAAVITIALGIGAVTSMFTVLHAVMLKPLPYADSRKLLLLWTDDTRRGLHFQATAYSTITDWQREARTFSGIGFYNTTRATIGDAATIERIRVGFTSANLWPLLAVAPANGRWLTEQEEGEAAPVALISHALWQRRYASDPAIVGKTVVLDNWQDKSSATALTIVGVMPEDFYFPDRLTDVWVPVTLYWRWTRESTEHFASWAHRWIGIGRLSADATVDDARMELAAIGKQLTARYPTTDVDFPGFAVNALPMIDYVTGARVQLALWLLMGATVAVLLVACANVGNLLLARGAARRQELGLRRALGATRLRLIRQFVVESLLLALFGGALGLLLAVWTTRMLAVSAAGQLPRIDEISVDAVVVIVTAMAAVLAGVLSGAISAMRVTSTDAIRVRRTGGFFVAAECCLAVLLVLGAGLMLRSFERVRAIDPGFDASDVLLVRVEFPRQIPVLDDLFERLKGIPDVESAGFIDDMFIAGQGRQSVVFPGRDAALFEAGELHEGTVTPGFFPTMRVPLRQGRHLAAGDAVTKARALRTAIPPDLSLTEKARRAVAEPVVVNDAFVGRFLRGVDPIGQRFCSDPSGKTYCYEVVGVVSDMLRQGPERRAIPQYFGPLLPASAARADLMVRTRATPELAARAIDEALRHSMPGVLVPIVTTADTAFGQFTAQRRLQTWLLGVFALVALALAAVGIYGIVHYAVSQHTREIGVRLALGARPPQVVRQLIASGMRMPLAGMAAGVAASLGLTRLMSQLLFEVSATDLLTFAAGAATLTAVALAACYLPARRAARLDPMRALRQD
jgi:predicted permease